MSHLDFAANAVEQFMPLKRNNCPVALLRMGNTVFSRTDVLLQITTEQKLFVPQKSSDTPCCRKVLWMKSFK